MPPTLSLPGRFQPLRTSTVIAPNGYHRWVPHLQLDLSQSAEAHLAVPTLLAELVQEFAACPTIEASGIKAYARTSREFHFGAGGPEAFVHLCVCILDGRPVEVLEEISDRLYETLKASCKELIKHADASVTLEVREMPRWTYHKR